MMTVLTVDELADRLRIGRSSAYLLVNTGRVRAIRVGRTIRVPASAVDEFLQESVGDDTDAQPDREVDHRGPA